MNLPELDVPTERAEQIRRRAHRALARGEPSWVARVGRAWGGTIEPWLVAATAVIYLFWAFAVVAS